MYLIYPFQAFSWTVTLPTQQWDDLPTKRRRRGRPGREAVRPRRGPWIRKARGITGKDVFTCFLAGFFRDFELYYTMYLKILIEGSLEVKLPTIWRDGKAEVGRVREEKKRSEKIREEKEEKE